MSYDADHQNFCMFSFCDSESDLNYDKQFQFYINKRPLIAKITKITNIQNNHIQLILFF